jgi:hypothetical protein
MDNERRFLAGLSDEKRDALAALLAELLAGIEGANASAGECLEGEG